MIKKVRVGGARPKNKVKIKWSPEFAYAIGLLATDGNLSPDERHMSISSKDKEIIDNLKKCLSLSNKIGRKSRGGSKEKKYYALQFGDVNFYRFLLGIGLFANKSKSLDELEIPPEYFFDFLRGHFDGDGSFYSYFDPRWKSSFMFYTVFSSASKNHIDWVRKSIFARIGSKGHISKAVKNSAYQLKYAKAESLKLLPKLYYDTNVICLSRKRLKIVKALSIVNSGI